MSAKISQIAKGQCKQERGRGEQEERGESLQAREKGRAGGEGRERGEPLQARDRKGRAGEYGIPIVSKGGGGRANASKRERGEREGQGRENQTIIW